MLSPQFIRFGIIRRLPLHNRGVCLKVFNKKFSIFSSIHFPLVFRAGEQGRFWYAVLGGSLEVRYHTADLESKSNVTLCNLGVGATFGESILKDLPRDCTVVTKTACELLRVEQGDFRLIWEKNKELMNDIILNSKKKNGYGVSPTRQSPTKPKANDTNMPNPALPITPTPSPAMTRIAWALRTLLVTDSSSCLKDRKVSGKLVRKCAPGTELVDWLINLSSIVHTRVQATGMWQALVEEGLLLHVAHEQPFKDKCFLYRFKSDEEGVEKTPQIEDVNTANDNIREHLPALLHRGPDATLRMILRKP